MTSLRRPAIVALCALVVTGGFTGGLVTVGLFTATESVSGTFATDESFVETVVESDRSGDGEPINETGDDEAGLGSHGGVENETPTAAGGDGKTETDNQNVTSSNDATGADLVTAEQQFDGDETAAGSEATDTQSDGNGSDSRSAGKETDILEDGDGDKPPTEDDESDGVTATDNVAEIDNGTKHSGVIRSTVSHCRCNRDRPAVAPVNRYSKPYECVERVCAELIPGD